MDVSGQSPALAPPFLDVPTLIEASMPERRMGWMRYSFGIFLLIVVSSMYISNQARQYAGLVQGLSSLLMLALVIAMAAFTFFSVRGQRGEQRQLETVEELIQLRRWPQAGVVLQGMLSQPARTPWGRVQGLIYLSGILARYHRFSDAISVQDYLLENINLDGATAHSLQLGRAMAMLREDHLFDADQAISELRRRAIRASEKREEKDTDEEAGREVADEEAVAVTPINAPLEAGWKPLLTVSAKSPRTHGSAGLALVEMYRDVKTGHPVEAEATFNEKLPLLRQQLGHRLGDAYVLVARAYDLLNRPAEAAAAYDKATLLAPAAELHRRYPEVAVLGTKYAAAAAPRVVNS
jgi:tetratricopeptide (TPR) repeat protein